MFWNNICTYYFTRTILLNDLTNKQFCQLCVVRDLLYLELQNGVISIAKCLIVKKTVIFRLGEETCSRQEGYGHLEFETSIFGLESKSRWKTPEKREHGGC